MLGLRLLRQASAIVKGSRWPCMFWLVYSRVVQVGHEDGDTYLWGSQYHPEFTARCIGIYLSDIGGNPTWALM